MSLNYNPTVYTTGLIHLLESSVVNGNAVQSFENNLGGSIWNAVNFSVGNTAGLPTFESNVQSNGSGSSYLTVSRNGQLETGSITFQIWFNLKNIPLNVGSNNNWRSILPSAAEPLQIVLEQSYVLNFTTDHQDGVTRRRLSGNFAPINVDPDGWQMITYTYDNSNGTAACYKNNQLVLSGPMTVDSRGSNPTTANLNLRYNNYINNGFKIYGELNTGANPSGRGFAPGEVGNIMIYNRALGENEVTQNFNALRGRYGI